MMPLITFLSSSSLIGAIIFLCFIGMPSASIAIDRNCQTQINQAIQTKDFDKKDFDKLESLLSTFQTQANCNIDDLEQLKRMMAQIAATQASHLMEKKGQLLEAERWLRRVPIKIWATKKIHGDIAAHRRQWPVAAYFYNQALDFISSTNATPQAPSQTVIQKIYQLASEAQILAGNLDTSIDSVGEAQGIMRDNIRDFKPKKRLIPIPFEFAENHLSEKGKEAIQQLAAYLKRYHFSEVTLTVYTDLEPIPTCACMSKKRAKNLKASLRKAEVYTKLQIISQGDKEPLQLSNSENYTQAEIEELNQRVELIVKH